MSRGSILENICRKRNLFYRKMFQCPIFIVDQKRKSFYQIMKDLSFYKLHIVINDGKVIYYPIEADHFHNLKRPYDSHFRKI